MKCQLLFATRVREVRRKLGWTQQRLAEELGVTFQTVNRWENGKHKPSNLALKQFEDFEFHVILQGHVPPPVEHIVIGGISMEGENS